MRVAVKQCVNRWLYIAVYMLLLAMLGSMIVISAANPQKNLFAWQMVVGIVFGTVALAGVFLFWEKYYPKLHIFHGRIYYVLLAFLAVFLYIVSCIGRNLPESFVDYGQVWQGAFEMAQGKELSAAWYFNLCANNVKPMLMLSVLFRIAFFLGIRDPFYFVLFISMLEVMGAGWSVGILVGDSVEEYRKYRLPVLLAFVFLLPVWANTQAFYTDSMSFGMAAIALAGMKLSFLVKTNRGRLLLIWGGGMFAAIGIIIKPTTAIPLIAGFSALVLCGRVKKIISRNIVVFLLSMLSVYGLINLWADTYEISQTAKIAHKPVISYVALGLKGDGSWLENHVFLEEIYQLPTTAEQIESSKAYILENSSYFYNPEHLIRKCRHNFASGLLGATDYHYLKPQSSNILYEMFSPWGKYFWRTSQYCFAYLFSLYVLCFIGATLTLRSLLRGKEVPAIKATADIALLGNMIFLMIWEANNRQLYNQMPVIILGSILNVRLIVSHMKKFSFLLPHKHQPEHAGSEVG